MWHEKEVCWKMGEGEGGAEWGKGGQEKQSVYDNVMIMPITLYPS